MGIHLLKLELNEFLISDDFKQILIIYYQDLETNHVVHQVHKKY